MKSPNTLIHAKKNTQVYAIGFTPIEVLVVVGLLAIFASMGLIYSFDSYRGYLFRGEYTTAVNIIARARNRAINNFDESGHGVTITNSEHRLYATNEYVASDPTTYESYPRSTALTVTGDTTLTFAQLSGDSLCGSARCTRDIVFGYNAQTKTITVNEFGGIEW